MEYCPLGDISQCFPGPVSEPVARDMCAQLLEGLGKLHEMKIIHRDIKPQVRANLPTGLQIPAYRNKLNAQIERTSGTKKPNLGQNRRLRN